LTRTRAAVTAHRPAPRLSPTPSAAVGPLKERASKAIDRLLPELVSISRNIHAHPELNFEERYAAGLLTHALRAHRVAVDRPVAGMETAFAARAGASGGVKVTLFSEYDALPEVGHGCGHNLIAVYGLGAFLGLAALGEDLPGSVVLLGSPAEEEGGGKLKLIEAGLLKGTEAAIMVHPSTRNAAAVPNLAIATYQLAFAGKAAHAAANPHLGINALDAVVQTFTNINALRQQLRPEARVHGIITHGGARPNIIPERAAAEFYVRAPDGALLADLERRVLACAQGAATATGARLEARRTHAYRELRPSPALQRAFSSNLGKLGVAEDVVKPGTFAGSTDMGDVSQVVPALHAYVAIAAEETPGHSPAFREAARSRAGDDSIPIAAKAMAFTAIDVLTEAGLREEMARDHRSRRKS
jgi:amidohydrolase